MLLCRELEAGSVLGAATAHQPHHLRIRAELTNGMGAGRCITRIIPRSAAIVPSQHFLGTSDCPLQPEAMDGRLPLHFRPRLVSQAAAFVQLPIPDAQSPHSTVPKFLTHGAF